jgi:predicted transcriptional regulator
MGGPRGRFDNDRTNNPPERRTVMGKDGRHRAEVSVYRVGEGEEVKGDKVVKRAKLRFVLKYGNVVKECVSASSDVLIDCNEAMSEIAKASNYNISKKELVEAISELREVFGEEAVPLVDYVKRKYPKELEAIEREPFKWVLEKTNYILGYDHLKLVTFLAIVSSRLRRVKGISRVNVNLLGMTGAGKSSVVKSVVDLLDDSIVIRATRLTEMSLGYFDIDSFDGKVIFLEQIDKQNVRYLREAVSEERICTYVTVKVTTEKGEEFRTMRKCIEGQPVFITTSVDDDIDLEKEQLYNRMLNIYVKYKYNREVIDEILDRTEFEVPAVDQMVFTAYLLTRPDMAVLSPAVKDRIKNFTDQLAQLTDVPLNRTAEIMRNLVRSVAIARGKTEADMDDYNFVMDHFQFEIFFNGLGLTERDIEFIEVLPDDGGLKTQEVMDKMRTTDKSYVLSILKNLERKGVVEGIKEDGRTFTWYLTPLGKRIKALVNNLEDGVLEVKDRNGEVIAETNFRPDGERGGNRGDAVPADDGRGVSRGEKEADRGAEEDELSRRISKFYGELKGKIFSVREFHAVLGDELAEKVLRWAEERGLVNHKVVGDEEFIEFV